MFVFGFRPQNIPFPGIGNESRHLDPHESDRRPRDHATRRNV